MAVLLPAGVFVPALEAAWLVHVERDILAGWNRDGITPPGLIELLARMREVAAEAGLARPDRRGSANGSVPVPAVAAVGSVPPELMLTAKQAADQLGISERAVTKATSQGHLVGQQVGRGTRWEITKASVDRYAPRRSNQARKVA